MLSNLFGKFAAPFIALMSFAGVIWLSYSQGMKLGKAKEVSAIMAKDRLIKLKQDKERNAKIKIMADNELLSRDELFASLQSKPDQGGK